MSGKALKFGGHVHLSGRTRNALPDPRFGKHVFVNNGILIVRATSLSDGYNR